MSIIAIEISDRVIESCRNIYRKVKETIREAKSFYSDGNSCYNKVTDGNSCYNKVTFERYM
ncbi:MAG: glypican family protein, partial [Endomicrobium sp.]|nr:glypican family protein [Endomicrobium sp.]